ncbi:MAG: hypothetical protein ACK47B_09575 [Armatimonadota bacterium]
MKTLAEPRARASAPQRAESFPEWAAAEVGRLIDARAQATTTAEQAELELRIAMVYDAAQRYGRSLADSAELP